MEQHLSMKLNTTIIRYTKTDFVSIIHHQVFFFIRPFKKRDVLWAAARAFDHSITYIVFII